MAVDFAKAYDEDIHLIREVDDEDGQALDAHFESLKLISKLGGDTCQYRRERAAQMNRILPATAFLERRGLQSSYRSSE